MLGRVRLLRMMHKNMQAKFYVPKRNWAQVGHLVVTPPRCPCSYVEKILHTLFMYVVWISPVAYFLTQLKVWRRMYIQDQSQ